MLIHDGRGGDKMFFKLWGVMSLLLAGVTWRADMWEHYPVAVLIIVGFWISFFIVMTLFIKLNVGTLRIEQAGLHQNNDFHDTLITWGRIKGANIVRLNNAKILLLKIEGWDKEIDAMPWYRKIGRSGTKAFDANSFAIYEPRNLMPLFGSGADSEMLRMSLEDIMVEIKKRAGLDDSA